MSKTEKREAGMLNAAGISYGELIRKKRKEKGLNQEELGFFVQVGKNAVGAWEAGRSRPDLGSIPVLCETLGISVTEFFGIRDEAGKKNEKTHLPGQTGCYEELCLRDKYFSLSDYHRQVILKEMDALLEMQQAEEVKKRKFICLYRNDLSACAGLSFSIGEGAGEQIWIEDTPVTREADELIRVSGDSMEPEFHDGDQVLVKHGASIRPGEVGIFTNGDAGYIKVYQRDGLHSLNPAYPTMRFHEGDEVRCIGKVLGIAEKELFAAPNEL